MKKDATGSRREQTKLNSSLRLLEDSHVLSSACVAGKPDRLPLLTFLIEYEAVLKARG